MRITPSELETVVRAAPAAAEEAGALMRLAAQAGTERFAEARAFVTGSRGGPVGGPIEGALGGPVRTGGPVFVDKIGGAQGGPVEFRDIQTLPAQSFRNSPPESIIPISHQWPQYAPDGLLQPGIYGMGYSQFAAMTGINPHRTAQLVKAEPMIRDLYDKGLNRMYFAGSFVTKKAEPGDIDALAHYQKGNGALLRRLFDLIAVPDDGTKKLAKSRFNVDLFMGAERDGLNDERLQFFQQNRGRPVGLFSVDLAK